MRLLRDTNHGAIHSRRPILNIMAKTSHVHKFKRHTYKTGNVIFFCTLPDCSVKVAPALALGKRSICWRCGNPFEMNDYSVRLAKPHCSDCHKPKNQKFVEPEPDIPLSNPFKPLAPIITEPEIKRDSLTEMRNRLSGIHARPDDEGDI